MDYIYARTHTRPDNHADNLDTDWKKNCYGAEEHKDTHIYI